MKNSDAFIAQIKANPENITFSEVINYIDSHYHYTPTKFSNGPESDCVISQAGDNEGSCKIFSFAFLHQFDAMQTLNCFGDYYRKDVLHHPDATNHANIRTFMKYGWQHISFEQPALKIKND